MPTPSWLVSALVSLLATRAAACTPATTPAALAPTAPAAGAAAETSEEGPSGAPREPLAWASFEPATFARAQAEKRFVVIDGAAEWCHWCHVMEATTYHDPGVRKILDARFIAVKVDVDSRPDFEERYGDWGWPATVLMTADGQEIGKYRGYLPPERLLEILQAVVAPGGGAAAAGESAAGPEAEARTLERGGDRGGRGLDRRSSSTGTGTRAREAGGSARSRRSPGTTRGSSCGRGPGTPPPGSARSSRSTGSAPSSIRSGEASASTRPTATGSTRTTRSS